MGKLIISESDGTARTVALDQERMTIGRHADNDVCLNDKAVSGHHAVIVTLHNSSILEDLNSTNGTQINGRQIGKQMLAHGDIITIGRNTLSYDAEAVQDAADADKTIILRAPTPTPAAPVPTAAPTPVPAAAPQRPKPATVAPPKPASGKLRILTGVNAGKEMDLSKALTTVGKPGVQVAAITRRADGYYIVHVGGHGSARPAVNGVAIDVQACRLKDGDVIEVAGTRMSFSLA